MIRRDECLEARPADYAASDWGTLRALQQLQGTQMLFDEREDVGKPKAEVDAWQKWSKQRKQKDQKYILFRSICL